ncbi:MAG: hypothetical protein KC503_37260 [Myxococcales bacterium]|nr:hypothetical protein [Myxococcales bacterium]
MLVVRRLARISLAALILCSLLVASADVQAKRSKRAKESDWFGPVAGDFELNLSGNLGHLFSSKFTAFDVGVGFGIFATDWLELGAYVGLGYAKRAEQSANSTSPLTVDGIGKREHALLVAPVTSTGGVGWYGSTFGFARFFPFSIDKSAETLPYWFAPFVGVSVGGIYAQKISPFFSATGSLGVNFYLTDQIALTLELGYALILSTESTLKFDGSSLEHALAAGWGLAFFFS